mmetsp:Transcript_15128/g.33832  ORF Transcript_15128/g.33832 Transcript_15128/m.33832 type:complete len:83 (+) Transcript_15128:873-1121(+)
MLLTCRTIKHEYDLTIQYKMFPKFDKSRQLQAISLQESVGTIKQQHELYRDHANIIKKQRVRQKIPDCPLHDAQKDKATNNP